MAWAIVSRLTDRLAQAKPFRSLTTRLTLAFLLVGLLGVTMIALLVSVRTRSEFDRFLSDRDQAVLVEALRTHYTETGSWQGLQQVLSNDGRLEFYSRSMTLTDPHGVVVLSYRGDQVGAQLSATRLANGTPILVERQTVGIVVFEYRAPGSFPGTGARPEPPANAFLERVAIATAASAGVAVLFALVLGGMLARGMTGSIRELTAATHSMARGQLGHQVVVRSRDEIGELATSFNQMSADLAQASQIRRQMTADLAHDLRTPLSILRGYTEGLKDARLQGSSAIYAIMHSEVEHLQRLVDDLRILSLADAGELPLNRRRVDPRALLERAGLAYIDAAQQRGLTLRVDATEDLPAIEVDTDRLAQVLNNLVANALRYTGQGEIVLGAYQQGTQIILEVRDTGSGIASVDLPHIFDRFYRSDQSRQRSDTGESGLGLAIARAIIEAHQGNIMVESALGQGATFRIRLPVAT